MSFFCKFETIGIFSEMAALYSIHVVYKNLVHDVARQNRDDVTVENAIDSKLGYDMYKR